ncbi:hypothetical protein CFP65_3280 [Kitasatospora sp. MMS16-BH015]|uniref:hypothetical protein n=1 Tax=Kitasatospora sp. MMS16-BH015 TaxID=2018025 RepID=UPI000CA1FF6E|nr:hypothetical protein [Kitasatospora sp. MMS16-BH015]AUG78081.1 hypothetical protein CFP65_3280 [Kitasatospora sp. MMS16-BH015]
MSAPDRADVTVLLHLVERAERGALLPGEAVILREGIRDLAVYREWCGEWSRIVDDGRRYLHVMRRALRRAVARAQRGRQAELEVARLRAATANTAEPDGQAYEALLAAQLLDGFALARAARRLEPVTRRSAAP